MTAPHARTCSIHRAHYLRCERIVNEIECVLRGLVTLEGWVGHNLIADGVCSLGNGVYCKLLMATLLGVKFGGFLVTFNSEAIFMPRQAYSIKEVPSHNRRVHFFGS